MESICVVCKKGRGNECVKKLLKDRQVRNCMSRIKKIANEKVGMISGIMDISVTACEDYVKVKKNKIKVK